jgi:hypothetical protein
VEACLRDAALPLDGLMPDNAASVHWDEVFENFSAVFGIVDASPVFITSPSRHQEQYCSGKFKRHCVQVQALVTRDGQWVCLSEVFRGRTHGIAMFDRPGVIGFLTQWDDTGQERATVIMADHGYLGIQKSGARAVLPQKRGRNQELNEEPKQHNRLVSHDRILVKNLVERWKSLFGICSGRDRGSLKNLSRILRTTIILTNWHIQRHSLRRPDQERNEEADEDPDDPVERVIRLEDTSLSDDE